MTNDIIFLILSCSDSKDVIRWRSVCKKWNENNPKYIKTLSSKYVKDDNLKLFTNLTSLSLKGNEYITDECIRKLTNLKSLSLYSNDKITDYGIEELTNLESLDLGNNEQITNCGIQKLTNLKFLGLYCNDNITCVDSHEKLNTVVFMCGSTMRGRENIKENFRRWNLL